MITLGWSYYCGVRRSVFPGRKNLAIPVSRAELERKERKKKKREKFAYYILFQCVRYRSTLRCICVIFGPVAGGKKKKKTIYSQRRLKSKNKDKLKKKKIKNHITQRLSRTPAHSLGITARGLNSIIFYTPTTDWIKREEFSPQTGFHVFIHFNISPPPTYYMISVFIFFFYIFFPPSVHIVCMYYYYYYIRLPVPRCDDIFTAAFHDQTPSFFSSP